MTTLARLAAILSVTILGIWPAVAYAVPGFFGPGPLSENTTGFPDATYTGPPDSVVVGLGGQTVAYDFGVIGKVVIDGPGADFNIYELDSGGPEYGTIAVSLSSDGVTFTPVDVNPIGGSIEVAFVSIDGDAGNTDPGDDSKSFDLALAGIGSFRFLRIDGNGTGPAGGFTAFDLDAVGAINTRDIQQQVPAPSGLLLLVGGVLTLGAAARRRRTLS